jgi:uncharacterized protein YuzE
MAEVKVYYDRLGNTLTVWFGRPEDESIAEETGDEIVLMKDKNGTVIGFEKLNFVTPSPEAVRVAFETITA